MANPMQPTAAEPVAAVGASMSEVMPISLPDHRQAHHQSTGVYRRVSLDEVRVVADNAGARVLHDI